MKNLQVRVKTESTTEPVTIEEAKLFCHVTGSEEDEMFSLLISAARKAMEKYTSSTFAQKTLHATWVVMPDDKLLELPYGPVISVDNVYLVDEEGTEEELTLNDDYWVYGNQDAIVKISTYWVTSLDENTSTVRVEYKAGYGDTSTEPLPDELKLAILKQVATDYELRENIAVGTISTVLTNDSKSLAAPYRKKLWF